MESIGEQPTASLISGDGVDLNRQPPIIVTAMGRKFTIQNNDINEIFDFVCQVYKDMTTFKTQSENYDALSLSRLPDIVVNLKDLLSSLVLLAKFNPQYDKKMYVIDGMEKAVAYMALCAMERMNMLKDAELERVQKQQASSEQQSCDQNSVQFTTCDRYDLDRLHLELDDLKDQLAQSELTPSQVGYKKLPVLSIKPFKGDKKDFLRFKTVFHDVYDGTGLSKTSLAIHLGENLEGEAKQKFAYMVNTADQNTYEKMWSAMETFYGTSVELAMEKLEKFTSLPVIKTFNPSTISMLYTVLEEHWALLKQAMKDQFLEENQFFFYSFLKKLPIHEVAKYRDDCRISEAKQNFPTFKDWLKSQWENYKEYEDKGTPDKALTNWQSGVVDSKPNSS